MSNVDLTEEITIVVLGAIAIFSVFYMHNNDIPLAIGSGLIGYLKGIKRINGNTGS